MFRCETAAAIIEEASLRNPTRHLLSITMVVSLALVLVRAAGLDGVGVARAPQPVRAEASPAALPRPVETVGEAGAANSRSAAPHTDRTANVSAALGRKPLMFIENVGQFDGRWSGMAASSWESHMP